MKVKRSGVKPVKRMDGETARLVTFRAVVVETETYKSGGKDLYHAVLDSLPEEPQRQAQFFGFDDLFKVGDVHVVTFSRPVAKLKRKVKTQQAAEIVAERTEALRQFVN